MISLRNLEQTAPVAEPLFDQKEETVPVCHALLQNPKVFALLLRIDHELAAQARADGCRCGGALHRADYPRKPRGCPKEVRPDLAPRLSFWCVLSAASVRRRCRCAPLAGGCTSRWRWCWGRPGGPGPTPAAARLGTQLGVARRTLERWRGLWREQFPMTPLWRSACARFMPSVAAEQLPGEFLAGQHLNATGDAGLVQRRLHEDDGRPCRQAHRSRTGSCTADRCDPRT
jgi:hypothetical protein